MAATPQPINAGAAAQPLVTPADTSVTSAPAVLALTDAFRRGFVTVDDIAKRTVQAPAEAAQAKAATVQANEFAGDPATQARLAGYHAEAARANLIGEQAQAAGPLVQPQAALTGEELRKQLATVQTGSGIDAFYKLAPLSQDYAVQGTPHTADGQPDYQKMGEIGNTLSSQYALKAYAMDRLVPKETRPTKVGGVSGFRTYNNYGEDITPGSPTYNVYHEQSSKALRFPDLFSETPGTTSAPAQTPAETPAASAPAAATVTPKEGPSMGSYQPGVGVVTGVELNPAINTLREELRKEKAYESWDAQKGFAEGFINAAHDISQVPIADQTSGKAKMNALDLSLAESLIKLYDPTAAIREFKWEKMSDKQPIKEQLVNWKAHLLQTGTLTPEARQRLVQLGYETIQGKERAAKSHVDRIAGLAAQTGLQPDDVLNSEDLRLHSGKLTQNPTGGTGASVALGQTPGTTSGQGPVVTLSNGQRIYKAADGQYYPAP